MAMTLVGNRLPFFGSYAPRFYFEAAELKLRESPLTPAQTQALCRGNAERLLG